jgi:hypothetical protein
LPGGRAAAYLLDVQPDRLEVLPTRMVVPLAEPGRALPPFRDLAPTLAADGRPVVVPTPLMAAVCRGAGRAGPSATSSAGPTTSPARWTSC